MYSGWDRAGGVGLYNEVQCSHGLWSHGTLPPEGRIMDRHDRKHYLSRKLRWRVVNMAMTHVFMNETLSKKSDRLRLLDEYSRTCLTEPLICNSILWACYGDSFQQLTNLLSTNVSVWGKVMILTETCVSHLSGVSMTTLPVWHA